jgi:hypothetical protein
MKWNEHYRLKGAHAIIGASKYNWLSYDDDKLREYYIRNQAAERGTRMHAVAAELIDLRLKMPGNDVTFNRYVNDAIAFRMKTEQILYFSENCFGTADAICFRKGKLRIHDLKTGVLPASMKQLEIYAAIFCLEYGYKPGDIEIELRIYQNDEVLVHNPTADDILPIMDRIITADKIIESMKGA